MGTMTKKNIFITGGSGFIGKNLNEYLAGSYNLFSPSHKELDLLDESSVVNFVKKNNIHIIINCANIGGGRDTTHVKDVVHTNLRMFFNIMKCSDIVKKVIHFGSGAEYDKSKPIIDVREEDSKKSIPKDDYGFYKYVCSRFIEKSKNIICLRLFGVYGKHENYLFKFISNAIVKNLLHMPIFIKQNTIFDYLYIDDLMYMIKYFIEHEGPEHIYNATRGEKIDLKTIAEMINSVSDYTSEVTVLNPGFNNEYSSNNDKIVKVIKDIQFTPHKQAIRKLYLWYKEHIKEIDQNEVRKDPYINIISVKK